MSEVLFINPRHKRRTHKRKARSSMRKNPRRAHRRSHESHATRVRAARKGWRHRKLHRNPRRARRSRGGTVGVKGFMGHTVIPAAVGATGAVALDVALGFLPIPDTFKTGMMKPVIGLLGALGMGMIAAMVVGRRQGAAVALGGATVVMYNTIKPIIQSAAPNVPMAGLGAYPSLEFYAAGSPAGTVGVYQRQLTRNPTVANRTTAGNMGMYVN
jgi:hypothetical protein